jgi:hypothetical protein
MTDPRSLWKRLKDFLFKEPNIIAGSTMQRVIGGLRDGEVAVHLSRPDQRIKGEPGHRIKDSDLRPFGTPGHLYYDPAAMQWMVFMRDGSTREFEWDDASSAWNCVVAEREAIDRQPAVAAEPVAPAVGTVYAVAGPNSSVAWELVNSDRTVTRYQNQIDALNARNQQRVADPRHSHSVFDPGHSHAITPIIHVGVDVGTRDESVVIENMNTMLDAEMRRYLTTRARNMAGRQVETVTVNVPAPSEPNILAGRKRVLDLGE